MSPDDEQRYQELADAEREVRAENVDHELEAEDWTDGDSRARDEEEFEFRCACGRPDCEEKLLLTVAEYREAHEAPHRFVVAKGHCNPEVERVVEEHAAFDVVEKFPEFQEPAEP